MEFSDQNDLKKASAWRILLYDLLCLWYRRSYFIGNMDSGKLTAGTYRGKFSSAVFRRGKGKKLWSAREISVTVTVNDETFFLLPRKGGGCGSDDKIKCQISEG
jgi:hypothetical protein